MNKTDNIRKNITNYPMDSHERFCMRRLTYNKGKCPETGGKPTKKCKI